MSTPRFRFAARLGAALALCLPLGACAAVEEPRAPLGPLPIADVQLEGIASIRRVGSVYVAGQPTPEGLVNARDAGVTLVINARPDSEMSYDEGQYVRMLGMRYVSVPFVPATLDDAKVAAFLKEVREHDGPILLHCSSGNRVAALWAIHEIKDLGVPPEQAVARARQLGLKSGELVAFIGDWAHRRAGW